MIPEKKLQNIVDFYEPWKLWELKEQLPHWQIFEKIQANKDLRIHTEKVVESMSKLLNKDRDIMPDNEENLKVLKEIIDDAVNKDKLLLSYTALFHDIGKEVIQARHGPEGADVIKDSGVEERGKFFDLGIRNHNEIFFMSDLCRFHDYFGSLQTGESSYLLFTEVLCPISNHSLTLGFEKKFLDYLLLLNIADICGTPGTNIKEIYPALMHDFKIIKKVHNNARGMKDLSTPNAIASRRVDELMPELKNIAVNHTLERLRRLLRTGLVQLQSMEKRKNVLKDYEKITRMKFKHEIKRYEKITFEISNWFIRDDETHDIEPLSASISDAGITKNFHSMFALTSKLDYMLSFTRDFIYELINNEIKKDAAGIMIQNPHDLRRDLGISLTELIMILINIFGAITVNDTRIGIGMERLGQLGYEYSPEREKLIKRMTCLEGPFKKMEAYKKIKDAANLWIIRP